VIGSKLLSKKELTIEQMKAELLEKAQKNPEEALKLFMRGGAQKLDPRGYFDFYELIMGKPVPPHAKEWVEVLFEAQAINKGAIIEAFRGSTKTTIENIFIAFLMGHMPHKSYLLIQVGDDIAENNTAQIANIIDHHPEWKQVFPHVVPDRDQGWGAGGYEVKDTRYDYGEWRRLCNSSEGKGKDPGLIGLGYKSRAVIGKHPTGGLFVDDIHDENNTASQRELNGVIDRLTGTIFPTMVPGAFIGIVGTRWVEGDALEYCIETGEFLHVRTPVYKEGKVPVWPEKFDEEEIDKQRKLAGQREFARMYLLDLEAADEDGLIFYTYPHSEINTVQWPGAGGCDYASVMEEAQKQSKDRDYFAHLWGFKDPYGRIIVYDGIVEKCTQLEAERNLWMPQELYGRTWSHTEFEMDGKGEDAYAVFRRQPGLRIRPFKVGHVSKRRRHEIHLAPWLENGKILISDGDTPALNHLRKALKKWPHWHLDAVDALYALARAFPEALVVDQYSEGIPIPKIRRRLKTESPYAALAARSR